MDEAAVEVEEVVVVEQEAEVEEALAAFLVELQEEAQQMALTLPPSSQQPLQQLLRQPSVLVRHLLPLSLSTVDRISPMKWLHLRMVCGVATNAEVPDIWSQVAAAPTKQEGLAILVQYLMSGMQICRHDFMGHADLLHVSIPLYNFVAGDRFTNPGENPACPAGGMSLWTSLQGVTDIGYRMATADADMVALDGRNAATDQIA